MLKIGHRGAKGYEPENTLIAFEKAIHLGVDGIELDVHLSSDNELIVIHDETVDRTTNGKGKVNQLSLKELKALKIENTAEIPTLTEVFDLVNQLCFINIELKGIGTPKPVIQLISRYISEKNWDYNHFLISSFDWKMLEETHSLDPKIKIGVLTEESIDSALAFAKKINAFAINPYYKLLSKENVILMQQKGFEIYPWTVNSENAIQKIKTFNVNGIISDFPDRIFF
ncbi:glycerophosphoryl diester phosphodiesterase [Flavobacterium flevense]|uniref:Glycerophosphoryl diester phosphodiesterase n=1 Tax=Flavobacterium flevense TaxID=983 RepID=A0A4Y4AVC4_9FLAO|nr:glycerophosphodiester phosphodiesterase family protein [Flavobacterium flevense]GEC71000.1 glycerophosphoryl diester phosphodiesterase [Flavobacterium flevense]SHL73866.1 glycerophosphoryl diester phosphodiesterase [Flavobacterium flevense]